jgi:hypothetical protein
MLVDQYQRNRMSRMMMIMSRMTPPPTPMYIGESLAFLAVCVS